MIFALDVILGWLEGIFASSWYWLVPLGTFLESMALVSLAAPGLIILILAGYYAGKGALPLVAVILLAILGTLAGDIMSYLLGRFLWLRFLGRRKLGLALGRMSQPLVNRTTWFMPFFHFSGWGRALVPLALGTLRMPFRRWIVWDLAGTILWNITFSLLGYAVGLRGATIQVAYKQGDIIEWVFLALFVGWLVGLGLTVWKLVREIKLTPHSQDSEAPFKGGN